MPRRSTMPVTYVIKFDVVPEQRANFLRLLGAVLDAMRHEPTFHQAVLHRDPVSENRFMLYETWESHDEVVNVQIKRSYRDAWHEALPVLLALDRDIEMWEPLC
ncbi:putative quinol monooxygenase [Bradyrhizobium iriomotense]|uniref:putative quinol monooxygenase n=1 Tax=Bradyrhizobium iriomotense TaxID=441950 RepID=UPI003D9B1511